MRRDRRLVLARVVPEDVARGVGHVGVLLRRIQLTLERVRAVLVPDRDARLVDLQVRTTTGPDLHDAVRRTRTVERGRRGALHQLDRLDVERRDVGEGTVGDETVDDDQRALRTRDGRRTAEKDRAIRTGLTRTGDDLRAGDLTLDQTFRRGSRNRHLGEVDRLHGERQLHAGRLTGHTGDDELLQAKCRRVDAEVRSDRPAGSHGDLLGRGRVPDEVHTELVRAGRDVEQDESALRVRKRTHVAEGRNEHLSRLERAARGGVRDQSGHGARLLGGRRCRERGDERCGRGERLKLTPKLHGVPPNGVGRMRGWSVLSG